MVNRRYCQINEREKTSLPKLLATKKTWTRKKGDLKKNRSYKTLNKIKLIIPSKSDDQTNKSPTNIKIQEESIEASLELVEN